MSSSLSHPVAVGGVVDGKYRIERVLGEGAMGVVVQAYHLDLEKDVALKFMLGKRSHDAAAVARFLREAKAAARLHSEHVARVLDVGRLAGGEPYMVMELLKGQDLGALVEQHGPLPPDRAVSYVLQACSAIAEAHAAGIVHRDLKPCNLFLAERGDGRWLVKVLDFGISKMSTTKVPEAAMTTNSTVLGSPAYMSPEQIRSARNVDGRTDIWSLGMLLYNLVTGTIAFSADSPAEMMASVLTEDPVPVRTRCPDLPDPVAAVIMQCLRKNPDERPESAAALAEALSPFALPEEQGIAKLVADLQGSVDIAKLDGVGRNSNFPKGKTQSAAPGLGDAVISVAQTESPLGRFSSKLIFVGAGLALICAALLTGIVMGYRDSRVQQSQPGLHAVDAEPSAALPPTPATSSTTEHAAPSAKPVDRDTKDARAGDVLPESATPPRRDAEPAPSKAERHGAAPSTAKPMSTANPLRTAKPPATAKPPPAKKNPFDISIK